MTPYQKMIEALHGVGDQRVVGAITAWLRGDRLVDPQAVAFLRQFYPDLAQAGKDAPQGVRAGPVEQPPAAPATVGSVVAPATGGAQGGARDNQPGVAGYNDAPVGPGKLGGGLVAGAGASGPPGLGGGVAAGAQAAGGLAAQWLANRSQNAAPMNPVPTPSAAPTQQAPQKAAGSVVGPMAGGGGISDVQGLAIGPGADNDFRLRQALKAAGVDPYSRGLRSQYLMQVLSKPLAAAGETLGLGGGGADPTTYLDQLKNAVLSFITPGRSGFGEQRGQAQKIMGDPGFNDVLGNLDTKGQSQLYQNLLQMEYGGENPAVQSAAQNVFGDTMNQYQDDQIMGDKPFSGLFSQYAQRDPKSSIARILAGLYGR